MRIITRSHRGRVMSAVTDRANHYLQLAIRYFERAEQAASPALKTKFRRLAGEYRDHALRLLESPRR